MSLKFRVFATFLIFSGIFLGLGFLNAYQNQRIRDRIQRDANSQSPELIELIRLRQSNTQLVGFVLNDSIAAFQTAKVKKVALSSEAIATLQRALQDKAERAMAIYQRIDTQQKARKASDYEQTLLSDLKRRLTLLHLQCAQFLNELPAKKTLADIEKEREQIEGKRREFNDALASLELLKSNDLEKAREQALAEGSSPFTNFALSAVLFLALACVASYYLHQHITARIQKLTQVSEDITQGRWERRVDISTKDEMGGLARNFNQMVDQLNSTTQHLESVIECMGDALVVTDAEGIITKVNDPLLRMLDYSEDELLGQNSEKLFAGPSPFTQSSHKILYREFTKSCDTAFLARSGDEIPISLTISLLMHKNGSQEDHLGVIYVAQDMTERKRYEKELIDAKILAEDGAKTKAEFLATMSHEIRTPMHGVIGMTELLLDTELNSTQRKFIEVIRVSGNSLLALLNDILDFSKIESDKLELEIQPLELRPLVEQAVELFSIKAAEKNLELAHYIAPSIPQFVRGDPIRIRQALVNLIGNAIKFTDSGEISIRVTPASEAKNKIVLQFSVEDTGIGIEADRLGSIFENFEQADNSISRRYGGTGLGLTISQKLVRLMGGKIWVESKVGLGSTFHFTISTTRSLAPVEAPFQALLPKLKGKRLLILERNATSRKDLHHQCITWGCEVYTCEYLSAAKDWLKQDIPFHAVLLDENCLSDEAVEGKQEYGLDDLRASCEAMNCDIITLRSISSQATQAFNARNELVKPVKKKELYNVLMQVIHGCERTVMNSGSAEVSPFEATLGKSFPARILVVEDNPINQQLAIHNFEKLGYRIELASNGQKALAALETKVFDIVFMDLRMPDMGGIEATQHIINNFTATKRPRIIAMTADAQASVHKECVEAGMDDFLTKPVKIRDLIRALRKWGPSPNSIEQQQPISVPKEVKAGDPIIDPQSIDNLKSASKDPRFVGRLIGMFLSQAPKFLQQIETGMANNDFHMIRAAAHNLKGDSSNFGAKALGEVASKIQDLDSTEIKQVREHIPELKRAYEIVEIELRKVAKEEQRKSGLKSKPKLD